MIKDIFKNIEVKKIFGTAGAGKTTYLLNEMEDLFSQGVTPDQIAFTSFTNRAVDEMVERSLIKFSQFNKEQFRNFRTIHSFCYNASANKNIMQQSDLHEVAKNMGLDVSFYQSAEDGGGTKQGDRVVTIESLARLRMVSLEQQWKDCNFEDCPLHMVDTWSTNLNEYKKNNKLIDFTDLLFNYAEKNNDDSLGDVKYFFIDESQDLCPLQWKVLDLMSVNCSKIYIAGDDDQAIYNWAGADVEYILGIKAEEEEVLAKSYRLPKNIYNVTRDVLKRIKTRKPKEAEPNNSGGVVSYVNSFDSISFDKDQEYLILVRNRYQLKPIRESIEKLGLLYSMSNKNSTDCKEVKAIISWERLRKGRNPTYKEFENIKSFSTLIRKYEKDTVPKELQMEWYKMFNLMIGKKAAYFRVMLGNGFKFSDEPKIRLSTIHQAKGGECQNVIVATDVSFTTWKNIKTDDEHRVWYVAVSRAKETLTIVREQSNKFYKI